MIVDEGKKFNLSHCGVHAMDIMRMESGFLHWGHDISPEENQYEANLDFTISYKKNIEFIGKKALEDIKLNKLNKKFVMLTLKDSEPGKPLMLHDEPIFLNNKIIGRTTSANNSLNYNNDLATELSKKLQRNSLPFIFRHSDCSRILCFPKLQNRVGSARNRIRGEG